MGDSEALPDCSLSTRSLMSSCAMSSKIDRRSALLPCAYRCMRCTTVWRRQRPVPLSSIVPVNHLCFSASAADGRFSGSLRDPQPHP